MLSRSQAFCSHQLKDVSAAAAGSACGARKSFLEGDNFAAVT